MANLCRCTVTAFIFGDMPKGLANGYDDYDLLNGIAYAEGLIEDYGFTHEPMDGFNLRDYIAWAKRLLGGEQL